LCRALGTVNGMNFRRLGRTGLEVSEIGYGAWGIGQSMWIGAEDTKSLEALDRAIDLGLNFIDTALAYGDGHSEQLVGQTVRRRSETVYVATKIPPKNMRWPARQGTHADEAFPGDYIRACTERSLTHLGLDAIDVQQFHVWHDDWLEQGDWLETVEALKQEGKIRFQYFQGDRKQDVARHVQDIVDDLGIAPEAIAETALRYILSHDAVSTVIPGMRSVRNVERNCAAGDGEGLPREQVEQLHAHRWIRNFYR
jgi:aryl-alcohol dehydrogenase-like predicted oxidoreductase